MYVNDDDYHNDVDDDGDDDYEIRDDDDDGEIFQKWLCFSRGYCEYEYPITVWLQNVVSTWDCI